MGYDFQGWVLPGLFPIIWDSLQGGECFLVFTAHVQKLPRQGRHRSVKGWAGQQRVRGAGDHVTES